MPQTSAFWKLPQVHPVIIEITLQFERGLDNARTKGLVIAAKKVGIDCAQALILCTAQGMNNRIFLTKAGAPAEQ